MSRNSTSNKAEKHFFFIALPQPQAFRRHVFSVAVKCIKIFFFLVLFYYFNRLLGGIKDHKNSQTTNFIYHMENF